MQQQKGHLAAKAIGYQRRFLKLDRTSSTRRLCYWPASYQETLMEWCGMWRWWTSSASL